MSQDLTPDALIPPDPDEQDSLRALNRSPHPYHHQTKELPYASDRFEKRADSIRSRVRGNGANKPSPERPVSFRKESSAGSESGTEADDEHFLKGLPAPKTKLHKGLRGRNEQLSGTSTPILSPAILEEEGSDYVKQKKAAPRIEPERKRVIDLLRHHRNLAQRATEAVIVATLGLMVRANRQVAPLLGIWDRGKEVNECSEALG